MYQNIESTTVQNKSENKKRNVRVKGEIDKLEVSASFKKEVTEKTIAEINLAVSYIEELLIAFNSYNEELWQSDNLMIKKII